MIILVFYIQQHAAPEWVDRFGKFLQNMELPKLDIVPLILPHSKISTGSVEVECIYPRRSFEFEEKESDNLKEIIEKLEERLRMEYS